MKRLYFGDDLLVLRENDRRSANIYVNTSYAIAVT